MFDGMYFDAVLDNKTMCPVFNDKPEIVKKWLEEREDEWWTFIVCYGLSLRLTTPSEYVRR